MATALVLAWTVTAWPAPAPRDVVERYAALAYSNYASAAQSARVMRHAVESFLEAPTESGLADARSAYLAARPPYGMTEAFRFYGGPIDDADGPEGLLNAWPLDESYIDAVIDDANVFPIINEALLAGRNEKDGERNIATGYHAIEYLLWGRDTFADGPGRRGYEEFVAGKSPQAVRRSTYLRVVVNLLVRNLEELVEEWRPDQPRNYREEFTALDPMVALTHILTGMGVLAGDELSQERMFVAYETQDQEEEHSCFSDTTIQDLEATARGIQNVYLCGVDALVGASDSGLNERIQAQLEKVVSTIHNIPPPFDQAILGDDEAPGRKQILAAVTALEDLTALIVNAGTVFDLRLNLAEGDGD